jgi:hypothetical protein
MAPVSGLRAHWIHVVIFVIALGLVAWALWAP